MRNNKGTEIQKKTDQQYKSFYTIKCNNNNSSNRMS